MKPSVSIFGCGWLGLPLGRRLAGAGYRVKGSVTGGRDSAALTAAGIDPFVLVSQPPVTGERQPEFFSSQVVVVTLPFRRHLPDPCIYRRQVQAVLDASASGRTEWIIFTGSTSVYPDTLPIAAEDTDFLPDNPRAQTLKDIENDLMSHPRLAATVVRLGGLLGPGRIPGRFLAGKEGLRDPGRPVNLIHLDDALGIIVKILQTNARGEIFNAVAERHPTREEFYSQAARRYGLPVPQFSREGEGPYKVVSAEKVKTRLGYTFRFPDPLTMTYDDPPSPRRQLFLALNFILCAAGAAAFLYFAVTIEKAGSRAETWMQLGREHALTIIGALAVFCVVICLPLFIGKKSGGKS